MSTLADEKENTSRRSFTKLVASALASVPLASTLVGAHELRGPAVGQTRPAVKSDEAREGVRTQHDTPPPILFMQGSLLIETDKDFDTIDTVGTRKVHRFKPTGTTGGQPNNRVFPAHIKIIDGSGEMLYRNLGADRCQISFSLDDSSQVNVQGGPTFDIDASVRLTKGSGGDKPTGKKRKVRYRHKNGGGVEQQITGITVTEGADVLYKVSLDKLPSEDEVRVLVWLEYQKVP